MSDTEDNYIWQYCGYDDGYNIRTDTVLAWVRITSKSSQAGLDKTTTNGGEYQFDIQNMIMLVIDFAFVSENIPIGRILSP